MREGIRQHLDIEAGGDEFPMVHSLGVVLIVLHRCFGGAVVACTGMRVLEMDDEMCKAWAESRLGDVDEGLDAELDQRELPLREELSGKGPEQQGIHLLAASSEVSIFGRSEVRRDLEKHLERNVEQVSHCAEREGTTERLFNKNKRWLCHRKFGCVADIYFSHVNAQCYLE